MKEDTYAAALKRRDEEVMGRVIDRYSRLLWKIASAVLLDTGSEQDVEECVADAFIHLWEHPECFDPNRGSLKTLLSILVRCRAIDRLRELNRRSTVPMEEALIAGTPGLQEALLRQETRQELLTAVRALEEPNREILMRRYYHDQKPRQIALAMGLTVKQVDNSLYRSKQQLRQALAGKGGTR